AGGGVDTISSVRGGGRLRVYIGRPWFSSGAGELLGVVLLPCGPVPLEQQAYYTSVGRDPIWSSRPINALGTADFPLAVDARGSLSLEETGLSTSVAGHEVQFDPERKLWFCDIQLAPG